VGVKKYRINVLKALVTNKGELLAHNAKAHMAFGSTLAWPTKWTPHGSYPDDYAVLFTQAETVESFDKISFDKIADIINEGFFGNPFYVNDWNRDITHESTNCAIVLYTIEGCDSAYSISSAIKPMKLPIETRPGLTIGMENAKSSQILLPEFRITSWDKLEVL
jgi:hypothetical protein